MAVHGIENMTPEQISAEVKIGARFVVFLYCISVVVMTFKRGSAVYFIRPGESTFTKSIPFTLCSLFLGWWGSPGDRSGRLPRSRRISAAVSMSPTWSCAR